MEAQLTKTKGEDLTDFSLGSLVREKRGSLSLRKQAFLLSISAATLSRIERGHRPDFETYQRIARWLELPSGIDRVLARLDALEKRVKELESKQEPNDPGKVLSWGIR